MNERFEIEGLAGAQTLVGEIPVFGSKNEASIAFPASLLFKDTLTLTNIPAIKDMECHAELLRGIGVSVVKIDNNRYHISVPKAVSTDLNPELVGTIRASVFLAVTVLARFHKVRLPYPGGDSIGPRPIDLFIEGLKKMGVRCLLTNSHYEFSIPDKKLKGAEIFLKIQSVGATQSLMLAGVLAEGTTIIKNAALEPEITHLADFLNSCGAQIAGVGTTTLTIFGTGPLLSQGKEYSMIPDRLETGTFLVLGVLAGKDVTITKTIPEHVESLLSILKEITTTQIIVQKDRIRVQNKEPLSIKSTNVRTHEYPGFASDLQPPLVVLLTQAEGKSLIFETLYEERFNYVGNLIQMGAKIITYDPHRISIRGKTSLRGAVCSSPDIRAGLAYVLSAIIAKGSSVIHNVYVIDRGYENIESRLAKVGVSIKRTRE